MADKVKVAILGPGNIGTDLMFKIVKRGRHIELDTMAGVVTASEGLELARQRGINTSDQGIDAILGREGIEIVLDCTSAYIHKRHAPLLKARGIIAVDLTPAAVGPYVVPAVNLGQYLEADNVNLITCGGQATIPIVAAVSRVTKVDYAEIIATVASQSIGPGTRQNIDEFTETTRAAIIKVGGALDGKAVNVVNPAEPPIMMRNTVYCRVKDPDEAAISASILAMVAKVQGYVPGYKLKVPPLFDKDLVTVMIEIEGEGDYLPKYAGNLDIMTAAAVGVAEQIAENLLMKRGRSL
jgi:acetaldehyde dehydrogenase (acetylating)